MMMMMVTLRASVVAMVWISPFLPSTAWQILLLGAILVLEKQYLHQVGISHISLYDKIESSAASFSVY
jgi:hypothetical protein